MTFQSFGNIGPQGPVGPPGQGPVGPPGPTSVIYNIILEMSDKVRTAQEMWSSKDGYSEPHKVIDSDNNLSKLMDILRDLDVEYSNLLRKPTSPDRFVNYTPPLYKTINASTIMELRLSSDGSVVSIPLQSGDGALDWPPDPNGETFIDLESKRIFKINSIK